MPDGAIGTDPRWPLRCNPGPNPDSSKRMLLDSIAEKVVRHARCPVLRARKRGEQPLVASRLQHELHSIPAADPPELAGGRVPVPAREDDDEIDGARAHGRHQPAEFAVATAAPALEEPDTAGVGPASPLPCIAAEDGDATAARRRGTGIGSPRDQVAAATLSEDGHGVHSRARRPIRQPSSWVKPSSSVARPRSSSIRRHASSRTAPAPKCMACFSARAASSC